jgi:hypothetical protein
MPGDSLQHDLAELLDYYEAARDTPDFILAKYLLACLAAFNEATKMRDTWNGNEEPS